jgi:hypothetical protein
MAGARVGSFEALRAFRAVLYKFAETADVALADAEGEMQRVMGWLERDQQTYWQFQLRKRHEDVMRCKEAVRMKKLFKSADGRPGSAVDEEKALATAMKRLQRGEEKLKAVMYYSRKLPKDILMYKGSVQRLQTAVQSDIPTAGSLLSRLVNTLEAYAAVSAPSGAGGSDSGRLVTSAAGAAAGMSRSADGAPERSQWAHLRSRTPDKEARNTATSIAAVAEFRVAKLAAAEMEALIAASAERASADPQGKVVIAKDIGGASRIYLERLEVAFPGDSGWYIGRADEGAIKPEAGGALTVSELLAARPDLIDVLTLPRGFLAIMDGGGLLAVLGTRDEELWTPPAPEPPPPPKFPTEPGSDADAAEGAVESASGTSAGQPAPAAPAVAAEPATPT